VESTDLAEAVQRTRERNARRAPVVTDAGELVGLVSIDELLPIAEERTALAKLIGT
jgi:Mg/Co/Ni transporter MgtE